MGLTRILSINSMSLARITAVYYSLVGAITILVYVFEQQEKVSAPLGLLLPYFSIKINLTFDRAESTTGTALQILFFMMVYGISGWISGIVVSVFYNLLSKYLGIQIKGSADPLPVCDPTFQSPTKSSN